jgi:hypothetical protein
MSYRFTNPAWRFNAGRFRVELNLRRVRGYRYDGDDEGGETQAALDSGEMVAFESVVSVFLDGEEIGADYLGGSVYCADQVAEFFTAHRDPNPENRNTLANGAKNVRICHYFPDMVRTAVDEARQHIRNRLEECAKLPRIRDSAR